MLGYSTNLVSCDVCVSIKRSNEAWGILGIFETFNMYLLLSIINKGGSCIGEVENKVCLF